MVLEEIGRKIIILIASSLQGYHNGGRFTGNSRVIIIIIIIIIIDRIEGEENSITNRILFERQTVVLPASRELLRAAVATVGSLDISRFSRIEPPRV